MHLNAPILAGFIGGLVGGVTVSTMGVLLGKQRRYRDIRVAAQAFAEDIGGIFSELQRPEYWQRIKEVSRANRSRKPLPGDARRLPLGAGAVFEDFAGVLASFPPRSARLVMQFYSTLVSFREVYADITNGDGSDPAGKLVRLADKAESLIVIGAELKPQLETLSRITWTTKKVDDSRQLFQQHDIVYRAGRAVFLTFQFAVFVFIAGFLVYGGREWLASGNPPPKPPPIHRPE